MKRTIVARIVTRLGVIAAGIGLALGTAQA